MGLSAPVPFVHARRRVPPLLVGQWLLENAAGCSVAMVEAEALVTRFNTVHVLVSRCEESGGWTGDRLAALSLMISGLIIMTRADFVRVIPMDLKTSEELRATGFGPVSELWSPLSVDGLPSSVRLATLTLDPHEWWLKEPGLSDQATLAYLEKRIRLEDEKTKPPRHARRSGIFNMMQRLIRWS